MGAKTLLDMAGVPKTLPQPDQAVLVIIDAQEEYRSGLLPLDGIEAALRRLQVLLAAMRSAGAPVLHVVHEGRPGGMFDLAGSGGAIMPEVAPKADEPVIRKHHPNAFHGTDLQERLAALGQKRLIIAGFQTHMCVSASARAALDLGHLPVIAADAVTTRALPAVDGTGDIAAETVHQAALAALADRFAIITQTDALTGGGAPAG